MSASSPHAHHPHAPAPRKAQRAAPSLLRASAGARLGGVAAALIVVWGAVAWAIG